MSGFVNFRELKETTTLDRVVSWLGLRPKNNRTMCPTHQGDPRELVFNFERGIFYCFAHKVGGDLIALAAHINGTDQKTAALAIQKEIGAHIPSNGRGLPTDGLAYLQPDNPEVHKMGLDTQTAAMLGAGFAPRGTMRSHVLLPIRDQKGNLLGYAGIPPGTKVKWPTSFKEPSS